MAKVNFMSAVAAMLSCATVQSVQASWFSSDFDGPEKGTVIVTVFNATSLDDEDTFGDSDVFVRAEIDEPGIHLTDPKGDSGYGVKDAIRGDDLYTWSGSNAYIIMKGVEDPMNSKLKIEVKDQDFMDTDDLGDYEIDMKDHPEIYSYYGKSYYEVVDMDIFSRDGRLGFNVRVISEDGVGAKSIFGGDDNPEPTGAVVLHMYNCTGLDDEDTAGDSDVYVKVTADEPGIHLTSPDGKSAYGIKDPKLGDELYRWVNEEGKVVLEDVKDPLNSEIEIEVRDGDLIGSDGLGDTTIKLKKHKAVTSLQGKDFCEVVDRDLTNTGRCCFNIKVIPNGDSNQVTAESVKEGNAYTTAPAVVMTLLATVGAMLF